MENKELLFNLVKKLESGEISFINGSLVGYQVSIILGDLKVEQDRTSKRVLTYISDYKKGSNNKFIEDFYKEKGLDSCWYKECSNQIYKTDGDYKALNIKCKDNHKRYICLNCYKEKHHDK